MNLVEQVYAQGVGFDPITVGAQPQTIWQFVNWVSNLIIIVGAAILIVMLAVGFIRYITSGGEKEAVQGAQQMLTYAIVGGIGLLLIYAIRSLIFNLVGVELGTLESYGT